MATIISRQFVSSVVVIPLLLIVSSQVCHSGGPSYEVTNKLLNDLIYSESSGYNKLIRPLNDQSQRQDVYLYLMFLKLVEIDNVKQTVSWIGFFSFVWTDERLRWNASQHSNINAVIIEHDKLWIPELTMLYTYDDLDVTSKDPSDAHVFSSGQVSKGMGGLFTNICHLNMWKFPFDIQECAISVDKASQDATVLVPKTVGQGNVLKQGFNVTHAVIETSIVVTSENMMISLCPANYVSQLMKLIALSTNVEMSAVHQNEEWEILNVRLETATIGVAATNNSISCAIVVMTFRRRPIFLMLTVVMPVVILSLLNIFIFVIPTDCGEKISFGITVLLSLSVYMSVVSGMVPRSSFQVPALTIYLALLFINSLLTVVVTIVLARLHHIIIIMINNNMANDSSGDNCDNGQQRTTEHLQNGMDAWDNSSQNRIFSSIPGMGFVYGGNKDTDNIYTDDADAVPVKTGLMNKQGKIWLLLKYSDTISFLFFLTLWTVSTIWFFELVGLF